MSNAPRLASAKRDWGNDATGCTILHIDMDAFYASCEVKRHPELAGKPVIVGTGNRAVVSAASYEARQYGVRSAMPVATARRLCPQGIFVPVDMAYYREQSAQVFAIFETITDRIERTSVDEGYMDVSGALLKWHSPVEIATYLRRTVREHLGLICSIGIAQNRFVAKLASTQAKPDGMLLIPVAHQAEFVQMLPLAALPGVGPSTCSKLAQWGIETTAQCAELTVPQLQQILGSSAAAEFLYRACRGIGSQEIAQHSPDRSIGQERTFDTDTRNANDVVALLLRCCDNVASTLRHRGLVARTVTIKLRFADLRYATRSTTLHTPTQSAQELYFAARALCEQLLHMTPGSLHTTNPQMAKSVPELIRLVGIQTSHLSDQKTTAIQGSFDDIDWGDSHTLQHTHSAVDTESSKDSQSITTKQAERSTQTHQTAQAEQTLDAIRAKFGQSAIHFGLTKNR